MAFNEDEDDHFDNEHDDRETQIALDEGASEVYQGDTLSGGAAKSDAASSSMTETPIADTPDSSAGEVNLPLTTPAGAKQFLAQARANPIFNFLAIQNVPVGTIKLVIAQTQPGWPPVELAYANVLKVPAVGDHICLDRIANERLRVIYRVTQITHFMVVNLPESSQTVLAYVQPITNDDSG